MARLLVTGSTGFVGRRVAEQLLAAGHEVVAVVRNAGRCPPGCRAVTADLSAPTSLARVTDAAAGCTILVHLAAAIPQSSAGDAPLPAMRAANVDTTRALMDALPGTVQHVVYASTLDVYGIPQTVPITEDHATEPTTAYGHSKREAEVLLAEHTRAHGMTLACLRLAQVYGPEEPPTKAIPRFIRTIAAGDVPVLFGDGAELRSFLYLDDAATAFVSAVNTRAAGVFNIAGTEPISIADTLAAIIDISGHSVVPAERPRAKPLIHMVLDTTRANTSLGFVARVGMREGLRRHYESHTLAEDSP